MPKALRVVIARDARAPEQSHLQGDPQFSNVVIHRREIWTKRCILSCANSVSWLPLGVDISLRHLNDKFCENCVYKSIAPHLHRPKLRNICKNFSKPVNDEPELTP